MQLERPDVLVVGGGPAGSTTAARLAAAGLDVLLVDRARFPREKACAEYASPQVSRLLRGLGIGSLDTIRGSRALGGMRIHSPYGAEHFVRYETTAGNRPYAVRRLYFDEALLALAADRGARVEQGVRATRVGPVEDGTVPVQLSQAGRSWTIRPRLVVGADGLRSVCAGDRQLSRPLRWPRRLGLVAHFEGVAGPPDAGAMHVGFGTYCGIAPLGEGLWSVAAVLPLADGRSMSTEALFARAIAEHPSLAEQLQHATRTGPLRGVGPMAKRVARASREQVLLVGDAAGFFDPFTGEGIHRAIRSGQLAAETVLGCFARGDFGDAALSHYDRARRTEVAPKERLCAVVQLFLAWPRLLDCALGRLNDRQQTARTLARVLGDLDRASDLLTAQVLLRLMA